MERGSISEFRLIEQMCWRPSLELLVAHQDNADRTPVNRAGLEAACFTVNPEVRFILESRCLRGKSRLEAIFYKLRCRDAVEAHDAAMANALMILRTQNQQFNGKSFVTQMGHDGVDVKESRRVLAELIEREIIYPPHATEL